MTGAAMPERRGKRKKSGKTGTVTQKLTQLGTGTGVLLMTGLDPGECEGCREALSSHGYAIVDAKPAGPGAWTLTPHE